MSDYIPIYIVGAWVVSAGGEAIDVINPATEQAAGQIALGSPTPWPSLPRIKRATSAAPICTLSKAARTQRIIMKTLFAMAAAGTLMLSGAGASTAEFPSYELMGFPLTPLQLQVVGSANVKEQTPSSTRTMAGMSASPHQVAVLTPRARPTGERAATNPVAAASLSSRYRPVPTRHSATRNRSAAATIRPGLTALSWRCANADTRQIRRRSA